MRSREVREKKAFLKNPFCAFAVPREIFFSNYSFHLKPIALFDLLQLKFRIRFAKVIKKMIDHVHIYGNFCL